MSNGHLRSVPNDPQPTGPGGGDGGNFDSRLRAVEQDVREIKTEIKHLATKEDLQKLKVWWLLGIIAGMGLAATVALGVLRVFLPS